MIVIALRSHLTAGKWQSESQKLYYDVYPARVCVCVLHRPLAADRPSRLVLDDRVTEARGNDESSYKRGETAR
jgi:hypothetical protein